MFDKCIYEHSLETPNKTALIASDTTMDYKNALEHDTRRE